MNPECLERKKKEYTFNLCKAQIKHDPTVEICIKPYDRVDENLNKELQQTGIEINAVAVEEFPVASKKPDKNNFHNEENYTKAHDAYLASDHDYAEKMEAICEKIESGDLKKVLYVGDATPRYCLAPVDKSKNSDPVKEFKAQDKKNKETALKHIFTDCLALLKTKNIPTTKLTMFEDELFLFILLNYLDKKDFPLFGINDTKKTFLTDSDKGSIIKSMTADQRAILVRRFIIKYFSSNNNVSPKSTVLLPQMAIQFFPGDAKKILSVSI